MYRILFLFILVIAIGCDNLTEEAAPVIGTYIGPEAAKLVIDSSKVITESGRVYSGDQFTDLIETNTQNNIIYRKVKDNSGQEVWVPAQYFKTGTRPAVIKSKAGFYNRLENLDDAWETDNSINAYEIVAIDSSGSNWHHIHTKDRDGYVYQYEVSTAGVDIGIAKRLKEVQSNSLDEQAEALNQLQNTEGIDTSEFQSQITRQLSFLNKMTSGWWESGFYYPEKLEYHEWDWDKVGPTEEKDEMINGPEDYKLLYREIKGQNFMNGMNTLSVWVYDMNQDLVEGEEYSEYEDENEDYEYNYLYYSGIGVNEMTRLFQYYSGINPYLKKEKQMHYVNVDIINWIRDNLIPKRTRITHGIYQNQFKSFFRMYTLAYVWLNPPTYPEKYEDETIEYFDYITTEDEEYGGIPDGSSYLYEKYNEVSLRDKEGIEYIFNEDYGQTLRPYMAIGTWMRRNEDGTSFESWQTLMKVMLNYDETWFYENVPSELID